MAKETAAIFDWSDRRFCLAAAGIGGGLAACAAPGRDHLHAGEALEAIDEFTTENIQQALNTALIEKLELKPRIAFGPLRTAISGRRISPPLFESMEILGKAETIERLQAFARTRCTD